MDPLWAIFAVMTAGTLALGWLCLLLWLQLSRVMNKVLSLTERFSEQIVQMKIEGATGYYPPPGQPVDLEPQFLEAERTVGEP